MSAVLIYGAQFRYHGLRGGLKKFMEPMPLLLPINLMEVVIRPLALCMRLFGNILGAFIIMELIKMMAPAVVPVPFSIYFDLLTAGFRLWCSCSSQPCSWARGSKRKSKSDIGPLG